MSELVIQNRQNNIRRSLLVTTSAIVLAGYVASAQEAVAADRPTIWIEGGWQFESITGSNDILVPPLDDLTVNGFSSTPTAANFLGQGAGGFPSFTEMEKTLGRSGGAEGSISFQPKGSDWVFSISGRYGRAHTHRRLDQRTEVEGEPAFITTLFGNRSLQTPHATNYVAQASDSTEAHTIVDFQVGKDIGIGLFGSRTESIFGFGARYAQLNMTSKGHSYAAPAVAFYRGKTGLSGIKYNIDTYQQHSATILERYSNFNGMGPSLSWTNTTGIWGDVSDGQLALDWGANAAVLFGRQKVKINYSTLVRRFDPSIGNFGGYVTESGGNHRTESHRVTVPNLGGFAALSYRFTNAKLSMGYRADFFFGAMDGGLDTRKSITAGFHGPYATIAVGLGG